MNKTRPIAALLSLSFLILCSLSTNALAQVSFKVGDSEVQVHGFASQGYAVSNENNYLTMKTSQGSFAMTDGGLNLTTNIGSKWFIGAQGYVYNVGELGRGHVNLDWATVSYKAKDWFGIRAGKVKTSLGLYTNTQDAESTYTWALLPQSIYPLDLRSSSIAHWGLDFYGLIRLDRAGSLAYTGYGGWGSADPRGGQYLAGADYGVPSKSYNFWMEGFDLRWNTPIPGLMGGVSFVNQPNRTRIVALIAPGHPEFLAVSTPQHITSAYADYTRGNWHFSGEFRRDRNYVKVSEPTGAVYTDQSYSASFIAASYRLTKRVEIGTYHSRFNVDEPLTPDAPSAQRHIYDQTATVRFDIARYWNVKAEGHFIDGYGDTFTAHGFYTGSNPEGLKPKTNMFILRTGWNF